MNMDQQVTDLVSRMSMSESDISAMIEMAEGILASELEAISKLQQLLAALRAVRGASDRDAAIERCKHALVAVGSLFAGAHNGRQ